MTQPIIKLIIYSNSEKALGFHRNSSVQICVESRRNINNVLISVKMKKTKNYWDCYLISGFIENDSFWHDFSTMLPSFHTVNIKIRSWHLRHLEKCDCYWNTFSKDSGFILWCSKQLDKLFEMICHLNNFKWDSFSSFVRSFESEWKSTYPLTSFLLQIHSDVRTSSCVIHTMCMCAPKCFRSSHVFIRQMHVTSAIFSNIILMWCDKLSRVVVEESLI